MRNPFRASCRRKLTGCFVSVALITATLVAVAWPAGASAAWSVTPTPRHSGSHADHLSGVACPKATNCFAVGTDDTSNTTLIEHWNGKRWSVMTSPSRTAAGSEFSASELTGVSCTSVTNCFAVGHSAHLFEGLLFESTLVEHWNGKRWSMTTSPGYAKVDVSILSGVVCASATSCFAVGTYMLDAFSDGGGFVEH